MKLRCLLFVAALGLGTAGPVTAGTIFGLIDTGELFVSANDGATWSVRATLPVRDAVSLTARNSAVELFLASRSGSVYRSQDAGISWTAMGVLPVGDAAELTATSGGDLLLLTTSGSLFSSADQGASWSALAVLPASDFVSLGRDGAGDLFALTRSGSVYASDDGGGTWTPHTPLVVSNAARIRASGSDLFAVAESGEVYESTDGGATWLAVSTLSQLGVRGFVVSAGTLYLATKEGHVASSPDALAWSWQGSINQLSLTALADDTPAVTGVGDLPIAIAFRGPSPNPSTGAGARFTVRIDRPATARFALYDVRGRRVLSGPLLALVAGEQSLLWEPAGVPAGAYRVRLLEAGGLVLGEGSWIVLE